MSWLETIGKPLRPTREEAVEYITAELTQAVPAGWQVERSREPESFPITYWRICRTAEIPKGEWPIQEYDVYLSAGLDFLIFTHSNNDIGPRSMHHALMQARVIQAWEVRRYGVGACLQHVMSTCKPNEWGYT